MSLPVLTQVYDEVRRLAIAGSVVASGDFRLKKLVPPLELAGQKAPVFAKVAEAVVKVVESGDAASAEALLELSTLVNAILYTQGETGIDGSFEPIETTDLGQQETQAAARVLKPLLEALTSTGSGRLELIQDAHERGAFRDLRLVRPALAALDDTYAEIADFAAESILPVYGKAILPELRARFDPKGRGGHVRRLALMHRLDPEEAREHVQRALEEGSKEVKVFAIECLGGSPEDLAFLLEQAKAKTKDVREAALKGLSRSDAPEAVDALRSALTGGDNELAIAPVRGSRNPVLLKFVLDEAVRQRDALLATKSKDKAAVGKQVARFLSLVECLRGRDDKGSEKFLLDSFSRLATLSAIKGEPGGKDIRQRLIALMAVASKKVQAALAGAHVALDEDELGEAFLAACRARPPKEVFETFKHYLTAKTDEKKKKKLDPALAKRNAIVDALDDIRSEEDGEALMRQLDPRWLDLAVKLKDLDLVQAFARPGHSGANRLLADAFQEKLKKSKDVVECDEIVETMIRIQHPAATDSLIDALRKHAKDVHGRGLYWLRMQIPNLPKVALPKLEALLPSLPEKAVDQLLDYVTQLKNRPE